MGRSLLCVFNGEFGWEVAQWQGVCRKLSRQYDKTYVLTDPGHGDLYSDFAEVVGPFGIFATGLPRTNDIFPWKKDRCYKDEEQEFLKFGDSRSDGFQFDILIHARSGGKTFKNYSEDNWSKIVEAFPDKQIASIGSGTGANPIDGTRDLRNIGVKLLTSIMRRAKVVVGPSSGPIHLAQHCGTPVVAWADNKIYMGHNTVRQRLEKTWNPFNATSIVIDDEGWQPDPERVIHAINETTACL